MSAQRRFGVLVILDSVVSGLLLMVFAVAAVALVIAVAMGISDVLTPPPGGERSGRDAELVALGALFTAAALSMVTIPLDVIVAAMSVRRLRGPTGDRPTAIFSLLAIPIATVMPLALVSATLVTGSREMWETTFTLAWPTALSLFVLAPPFRLAQLISGLVTSVARLP